MITLTPDVRRALLSQRDRERARHRHASSPFGFGFSGFTGFAGRAACAGAMPRARKRKAPYVASALFGIADEDWRGPGWYWLWHVATYRGRRQELLQLVYVEADGEISAFDEIDEAGSYC